MGLLVLIEMIYIFSLLVQTLRCQDRDLNSVIFIAAIHIYLLQVGPLRRIGNQRITAQKHFFRRTILHIVGVHLALALLWNPTGLVVEWILSAVETSDLPQYLHLIRVSTALSFLWCCWHLPKNRENFWHISKSLGKKSNYCIDVHPIWDAFPSKIQLGSLGLQYRERFPIPREPSYHAVPRVLSSRNKYM